MNCLSCHKPTLYASVERIDRLKVQMVEDGVILYAALDTCDPPKKVRIIDIHCGSCYRSWTQSGFLTALESSFPFTSSDEPTIDNPTLLGDKDVDNHETI